MWTIKWHGHYPLTREHNVNKNPSKIAGLRICPRHNRFVEYASALRMPAAFLHKVPFGFLNRNFLLCFLHSFTSKMAPCLPPTMVQGDMLPSVPLWRYQLEYRRFCSPSVTAFLCGVSSVCGTRRRQGHFWWFQLPCLSYLPSTARQAPGDKAFLPMP